MAVTASELRRNVYRLLDEVLESGVPLEIVRRGRTLRIVPVESESKRDRLKGHPAQQQHRLPQSARRRLDSETVAMSPMAVLEIAFLAEAACLGRPVRDGRRVRRRADVDA